MWVPRTAAELERAARDGLLQERQRFEAKRELPARKNNVDIAIDVSALTVDGGLLIYGIAEDDHDRPAVPSPIELAGSAERVDQVVYALVDEPPVIEMQELRLDDAPGRGYLVVAVPESPRAPHQVAMKGEYRFYGRGEKGNRILSQGEVARLYVRREQWEVDAQQLLAECVAASEHGRGGEGLAFLHAFARPVVPDERIWDAAVARHEDQKALLERLRNAAHSVKATTGHGPALQTTYNWRRRGADVWTLDSTFDRDDKDPRDQVRADVNVDGRGYLFCGPRS